MKKTLLVVALAFVSIAANAQYVSSGTGRKISLQDIASESPQTVVSEQQGVYAIYENITISRGDTLWLDSSVNQILFHNNLTLCLKGAVSCDFRANTMRICGVYPETDVVEYSIRFDSASSSRLYNICFENGKSIVLINSDITFDQCYFTGFVSQAIRMMYSNPVITNCSFYRNREAAINSGANTPSSPKITGSLFYDNVLDNVNQPQINLGPGSDDTIMIVGNWIEGVKSDKSGGIAVANIMATHATKLLLSHNTILNNRYGYNQQGYNIQSLIEYNDFIDNNLETNPMNGGSGISIYGYDTACAAKIRHNTICGNLWGLTAIYRHHIDLGTAEEYGNNLFYDNINNQTVYALYNNSYYDDITAVGNYWGGNDTLWADSVIFDRLDDSKFAQVFYKPILMLNPEVTACRAVGNNDNTMGESYEGVLSSAATDTNTFIITFPVAAIDLLEQGLYDFKLDLPFGVTAELQNKPEVVSADTLLVYNLVTPHKDSAKWYIRIQAANRVSASTAEKSIVLYPNPCYGGFNLKVPEDDYQMRLYNSLGQFVKQVEFRGTDCYCPVEQAGNYILLLQNSQGIVARKTVSVLPAR